MILLIEWQIINVMQSFDHNEDCFTCLFRRKSKFGLLLPSSLFIFLLFPCFIYPCNNFTGNYFEPSWKILATILSQSQKLDLTINYYLTVLDVNLYWLISEENANKWWMLILSGFQKFPLESIFYYFWMPDNVNNYNYITIYLPDFIIMLIFL